jgi:hypothetical protein
MVTKFTVSPDSSGRCELCDDCGEKTKFLGKNPEWVVGAPSLPFIENIELFPGNTNNGGKKEGRHQAALLLSTYISNISSFRVSLSSCRMIRLRSSRVSCNNSWISFFAGNFDKQASIIWLVMYLCFIKIIFD